VLKNGPGEIFINKIGCFYLVTFFEELDVVGFWDFETHRLKSRRVWAGLIAFV
jgi:hypothetical protein